MKYLWFLLLFFAFACKKDKNVESPTAKPLDTIKPNPYLPAFPGSWWKYTNDKGDTTRYTTGSLYVMDTYSYFNEELKMKQTYAAMVPVYMGRKIWGRRERVSWAMLYPKDFIPVVSDSLPVGTAWETGRSSSHSSTWAGILKKDTSIIIDGKIYSPTIVVDHSNIATYAPVMRYAIEYYTKDIGLVKRESFHYSNPDSVTSEMKITSYFIKR